MAQFMDEGIQVSLSQENIDRLIDVFTQEKFLLKTIGFKNIYRLSWSESEKFPNGMWFTTNIEYAKMYIAAHVDVASSNQKKEWPFLYEAEPINDLKLLCYNGEGFFNDMSDIYSSEKKYITQARVVKDLSSFVKRSTVSINGFYMKKEAYVEMKPVDEIFIPNAENVLRLIKTTNLS